MNVITILCDTLRRDHVGACNGGLPLNRCWSQQAPEWSVATPNMDRLITRGTVFDNAYIGSTPCMPARRDILEFLERGWGPLEEEDFDLPRQISGPPNRSVAWTIDNGYRVSYLLTDHFHLWEQGSGNYHMGYTGFEFVRGIESDALYTDPVEFFCPDADRQSKLERHWRNIHTRISISTLIFSTPTSPGTHPKNCSESLTPMDSLRRTTAPMVHTPPGAGLSPRSSSLIYEHAMPLKSFFWIVNSATCSIPLTIWTCGRILS